MTAPSTGRSVTRLVVVTAGLSQPSSTRLLADRLSSAVESVLAERGQPVAVEVVELREYARDLTNHLLTGFPTGALGSVIEHVATADALVVVTPIFSASYSGLFKTFFDVLPMDSLVGKPTIIAATAGTARHSLALEHALRPLFAYLRAVVVPTAVFAAAEDWASEGALTERVRRAATELADLLHRAPVGTTADTPGRAGDTAEVVAGVESVEHVADFADLLAGRVTPGRRS
ncbi:MAG: reductase [Friedmanniella sp.]|nr:reductase [Friedmanniella sp.]